jgi:hypothetical protein
MSQPSGSQEDYRNTFWWRIYDEAAQAADRAFGWDKLPRPLGLLVLIGLRNILRQRNLYDTSALPSAVAPKAAAPGPETLTTRTPDGSYNDLGHSAMGMAGTRFGRNVPLRSGYAEAPERILEPNPREVSRELLTRHEFIPATSLNLLAAAWIQFMVKDWFSHGAGDPQHHFELPLADDDPWPQRPLQVLKTLPDPTRAGDDGGPQTFLNTETHWWDASQVYGGGTTARDQLPRRSGQDGKLLIGPGNRLVFPDDPALSPAYVPGWWLGLTMMSTIFVREHNAIADALKTAYPQWADEDLYQRARLITAALIAKIHTSEWTPAIIAHPTTILGMSANWWGLEGKRIHQLFGRLSNSEVISGIPGSETNHYGVPYSLTEEFSIIYRMHPLIADNYTFRSAADDQLIAEYTLPEITGPHAQEVAERIDMGDAIYSFAVAHPGALVLNNFPRFLQQFQRPDNDRLMDLAATDILRTRELGVPRYNQFRQLLHLKPAQRFEDLTDDPAQLAALRRLYRDVDSVDTIVGMLAEKRPAGFAFSDTAFRIFIVMASRRLNSDRYFTQDFTPEIYTQLGMDWVQQTSMTDIMLRHYPQLRPALRGVANAFQPWQRVAGPASSP